MSRSQLLRLAFNGCYFLYSLREILLSAEDMEIDMPMFWQYVAEILSPMYEGLALPFSSLKIYSEALTEERLPGKLLTSVINVISKKMVSGLPSFDLFPLHFNVIKKC